MESYEVEDAVIHLLDKFALRMKVRKLFVYLRLIDAIVYINK